MKKPLCYITKPTMIIALFFYYSIFNVYAENHFSITDTLKNLESNTQGRLGVFAINTENGHVIDYRGDEIFPTGCTSKTIGVAAVLKKSMSDPSLLLKKMQYSKDDLDEWSPVTGKHVSEGMTVQELCAAAISLSDNTAMNLLLNVIGGVEGMNDFARSIGDPSFRQDNDWPAEAFSGGINNVKDASTSKSMVESLHKLTIGNVLGRSQRDLLTKWLIETQTGAARIRSSIPKGWVVGNKTGTGGAYGTTNDLAVLWPHKHAPILIGIYYTSNNAKAVKREDLVSAVTKVLIEAFMKQDKQLTKEGIK